MSAAGCDSAPTQPTKPLTITCPPAQAVEATTGGSAVVNFPPPVVAGAVEPSTLACKPPSGSTFPPGISSVGCTVRDAQQRTVSCTFQVTVSAAPRLTLTKFAGFGDSITAGVLDPPCPTVTTSEYGSQADQALSELALLQRSVNVPTSYPTLLQGLLRGRYTSQSVDVINEGLAGESIETGVTRLPSVLSGDMPQVLLLQEGINNLNSGDPASVPFVVNGLRTMVRDARSRGVTVFVGTLLPERASSCRGGGGYPLVPSANDGIRAMSVSEGAYLVDLYNAFGGVASTDLIGVDGLHPTAAGYQRMADTFYAEIRNRLELR